LHPPDKVLPPVIEEVIADGKLLPAGEDGSSRLRSGVQRMELHFTSPTVNSPQKLRFRIMMDGLDQDWVDVGNSRETAYNRVPPGNYHFRVAAASAPENVWRESKDKLRIEVVPRFWERQSVRSTGVVLLFAIAVAGAWRFERNRTRRRLERLEAQEAMQKERQRIARDIHDDLGTGLTEILLASKQLGQDAGLSDTSKQRASAVANRARSLTRSMEEVVWAINPHNDNLDSLATYLNHAAQQALTLANVRCRWDIPEELPDLALSAEARHNLFLACKEAINNVIKHAAASEVWIRLQVRDKDFILSIEDDGHGFDPTQSRIHGNGLCNIRQRVVDCGGQCEISSGSKGTQIRLVIPTSEPVTKK
jgi:signal transduction histidine kinase